MPEGKESNHLNHHITPTTNAGDFLAGFGRNKLKNGRKNWTMEEKTEQWKEQNLTMEA